MTEEQLFKDPEIKVSPETLKSELGKRYPVFSEFLKQIESKEFGYQPEWRYYKDGKAWLCKVTHKKKTVAWVSLWRHCFKVAWYFTEKTGTGIEDLDISETLKTFYKEQKPIGKLKPIVSEVTKKSQLPDVYTLMRYKTGKTKR